MICTGKVVRLGCSKEGQDGGHCFGLSGPGTLSQMERFEQRVDGGKAVFRCPEGEWLRQGEQPSAEALQGA